MLEVALGSLGIVSLGGSVFVFRRGLVALRIAREQPDYLSEQNAHALTAGYLAWRRTQVRAFSLATFGVFALGVLLGLRQG